MVLQNQDLLIMGFVLFCFIYYYGVFKYSTYLKNKDLLNNIKNKVSNIKNINTFDKNYEEPLSFNTNKAVPIDVVENSRDWKKDLSAINSQQEFVENNNILGNYINETDLKNPELN
jgi:hypothetical protein